MTRIRSLAVMAVLGVLPVVLTARTAQGPPAPLENPCLACHEDVTHAFLKTPHGKAMKFQAGRFQGDCQACHSEATAHMETGDPSAIFNPAKVSAAETNESCLACHQTQKVGCSGVAARTSWQGTVAFPAIRSITRRPSRCY